MTKENLYFGALLNYCCSDSKETNRFRCIYVQDDNGMAVVIFQDSNLLTRVKYEDLEWWYK